MADLIDLARTKAEKKAEIDKWETTAAEDRPDYPYGLNLFLDYETLKKLGMTDHDFDAGLPVTIHAEAMISEDRVEVINGEKRHSISLQVQKMAIGQGPDKNVAEKFYAGGKD